MSAANARPDAAAVSPASTDRTNLFKEDRPRRIDRFISFFGESAGEGPDVCGDQLLESLSGTRWSER